jgi:excisionase family DNA binding protein
MITSSTSLYLSPRETADLLGVSRQTVYRLCNRGVLPSVRVGGQIRVPRRELTNTLINPHNEETAA